MFLKKLFIFFLLVLITVSFNSCAKRESVFNFAEGKDLRIALVVSGPVNDSSWNEAAYNGLKRFQSQYKAKIAVVEKVSLQDAKGVFSELADRKFNLIIGHGYEYGNLLKNISKKYLEVFFCVVGGEVSQEPNLCSFNFKDEQYGYIIGVAAGLNTTTNKVGIVVGNKIPSIERAIVGMRRGLRAVNPKADLVVSYINTWDDITKGREAALAQIDTGVDVITHLADASGVGVIKAAEEADISAIGAVKDQHDIAPSTIITSGIEDASQLVYLVSEYYLEKMLQPSIYRFGLKDNVIDLTPGYGNIDPITETRINNVKNQLVEQEKAQGVQSTKTRGS